jgi:hypothetical protein
MLKKICVLLLAAFAIGLVTCELDVAPRVNVSFDDPGGGNTIGAVVIKRGESLGSKLPKPTRPGPYTLFGWFDGATRYDANTPIFADVTLTARWSDDVCTVSFEFTQTTDGSDPETFPDKIIKPTAEILPVTALKGVPLGPLNYPVTPRAKGWTLETWELEGEDFTYDTPVPGDIVLTARWIPATVFTVTFNPGPGAAAISPMQVFAGECIDEWEKRFPPKPTTTSADPRAFFVDWLDNENRVYDGTVPITRNITINGKWGLPPFILNLRMASDGGDIDVIAAAPAEDYGNVDYAPVVREAWDSPNGPGFLSGGKKYVIVNTNTYDVPNNTNRWRIIYRIKLKAGVLNGTSPFDVGFYSRYTIRARFYGNQQATQDWTGGGFQPNTPCEESGYKEKGLLVGVSSQSDDGWGQISWCLAANWDGQGANDETLLQRYNLDRKGGTINDVWAPMRALPNGKTYPEYLIVQTSDNYIGHIEIYQIVFHNGEWEHGAYEGEEPPKVEEP